MSTDHRPSVGGQKTKNRSRKFRAFVSLFASASLVFAPLNVSAANAVEVELSLVKDIYIGSDDGLQDEDDGEAGAFVGSTYFFPAYDGTNGRELWKSDGTEAGTVLVKNIRAGSSSSSPSKLMAVGSTLYFSASDGTHGRELWKSDGTEAGTVMVKDIRALSDEDGPLGGNLDDLIAVGSTLYFSANDGTNGDELWKSDGTAAGTVMVKNIRAGSSEDGPYSGDPGNMITVGTTVYFSANDGTNGYELWKSDGTAGGTVMVKNIRAGSSNGDLEYLTAVGNTLYFSAQDGTHGRELWKSDGTESGTTIVKDIRIVGDSGPEYLTAVGNTLYFSAYDDLKGRELWKSDGTEAGTVMVKDIAPGDCDDPCSSVPLYLTAVGNTLYFSAYDDANGDELWKSDGTEAGTVLVKDIWVGPSSSSNPSNLIALGSTLFFSADDGTNRRELWKSDGTGAGTSMVENINPNVGAGSTPNFFSASASTLFFRADNGTVGRELWALRSGAPSVTTPPTTQPEAPTTAAPAATAPVTAALARTGTTSSNYLALVPLLLAVGGLFVWLGRGRRIEGEPQ